MLTKLIKNPNSPRMPTFSSANLEAVFNTQNFTTAAISSGSGQATTGGANGASSSSAHTNVGAIVGGVIGGVVALAVLGALVFLCISRRRKRAQQQHQGQHEPLPAYYARPEMSGDAKVAELPGTGGGHGTMAAESMNEMERKRYAAVHHASSGHAELPGQTTGTQVAPAELPS